MKPVITSFLRRLDKMVAKIHKNQRIYVSIDWKAVSVILSGKTIKWIHQYKKTYKIIYTVFTVLTEE